jgi:glycosyltransferase involved in cell wall biosynthesis
LVKFSVVIPLYNKGPHVKRALDSVMSQTIQDFEVIVVDGGSNDHGSIIVESFTRIDSRVRLVQQVDTGVSTGVSEARNQGICESKSALIAFLDADDEWLPNYLETILRLRKIYPFAGIYATSLKTEFIDNLLMKVDEELRKLVYKEGLILNYFKVCQSKRTLFTTSSVTVPKKVFSEIGGFQSGFWWGEDIDMWGRIALKYPIAYSSQVCAIYYHNVVNSASKRMKPVEIHPFVKTGKETLKLGGVSDEVIKDLEEYIKFVEMFTAKHNIESGDKNLAFKLLIRSDIKLAYKKTLLNTIISTAIKNKFKMFLKFLCNK